VTPARPRSPARVSAVLALAAAAAARLPAASLAGPPVFTPPGFGPGDEATVVAPIAPGAGEKLSALELAPGAGLPERGRTADPELRALKLAKGPSGWELRIRFVPWSPGAGQVPALSARGVSLPALSYESASRLGPEDLYPSPPRPQRMPPGAAMALYLLGGAALALGLAAFGFVAYLLPASRALLARWRAGQAFRRLGRSLDYLVAHAGSAEGAAFSAALARALRNYLAARVSPEAPALTAAEISALPDAAFPSPSIRDRSARLLSWSDEVRFGGARAGAEALASAAEEARRIAAESEEALLARA
jgi:hypothetical protein